MDRYAQYVRQIWCRVVVWANDDYLCPARDDASRCGSFDVPPHADYAVEPICSRTVEGLPVEMVIFLRVFAWQMVHWFVHAAIEQRSNGSSYLHSKEIWGWNPKSIFPPARYCTWPNNTLCGFMPLQVSGLWLPVLFLVPLSLTAIEHSYSTALIIQHIKIVLIAPGEWPKWSYWVFRSRHIDTSWYFTCSCIFYVDTQGFRLGSGVFSFFYFCFMVAWNWRSVHYPLKAASASEESSFVTSRLSVVNVPLENLFAESGIWQC